MKKILQLLGLGQRARSVVSGDEGVRAKLERRQARLIIIAADAADSTTRDFTVLAKRFSVPCLVAETKTDLGAAVGKSPRAVVALLDDNLVNRILELKTPEDY
ncbi:MAG: 50S ribosomal protein L7 [Desulforudis sp.]|jgi:ribosomal protein L7Ae-like RNA K-turn-binding protein|nr:L7Ae/L30e/S12e/Gadd45 family ribosomal protein [Clostridia bacterium]MDQ7790845.1 L7Ae/L30e/S12e/Gadd45 family ribosomal protein [Clostridia bacterium]RJX22021.1 MAG: 50S ribosomal protein L7 [Desulforudis sp.]